MKAKWKILYLTTGLFLTNCLAFGLSNKASSNPVVRADADVVNTFLPSYSLANSSAWYVDEWRTPQAFDTSSQYPISAVDNTKLLWTTNSISNLNSLTCKLYENFSYGAGEWRRECFTFSRAGEAVGLDEGQALPIGPNSVSLVWGWRDGYSDGWNLVENDSSGNHTIYKLTLNSPPSQLNFVDHTYPEPNETDRTNIFNGLPLNYLNQDISFNFKFTRTNSGISIAIMITSTMWSFDVAYSMNYAIQNSVLKDCDMCFSYRRFDSVNHYTASNTVKADIYASYGSISSSSHSLYNEVNDMEIYRSGGYNDDCLLMPQKAPSSIISKQVDGTSRFVFDIGNQSLQASKAGFCILVKGVNSNIGSSFYFTNVEYNTSTDLIDLTVSQAGAAVTQWVAITCSYGGVKLYKYVPNVGKSEISVPLKDSSGNLIGPASYESIGRESTVVVVETYDMACGGTRLKVQYTNSRTGIPYSCNIVLEDISAGEQIMEFVNAYSLNKQYSTSKTLNYIAKQNMANKATAAQLAAGVDIEDNIDVLESNPLSQATYQTVKDAYDDITSDIATINNAQILEDILLDNELYEYYAVADPLELKYDIYDFVANNMNPSVPYDDNDDTGYCVMFWDVIKANYNNMSEDQRECFNTTKEFEDPKARLDAWAERNGDVIDGETNTIRQSLSHKPRTMPDEEKNSNIIAITVISSFALLSTAALFLYAGKKKRYSK